MNDGVKRNLRVAILATVPSLPVLWLAGWIVWLIVFVCNYCMLWITLRFWSYNIWSLIMTLGITENEYVALRSSEAYKKNADKVAKWIFFGGKKPRYQGKDVISIDAACRMN